MAKPAQGALSPTGPNILAVGQAFVRHYYGLFDTDRSKLAGLYQAKSNLTFEGVFFQGTTNIMNKLMSLNFKKVLHLIKTVDCQPSGCGAGIIVVCCGDLKVRHALHSPVFADHDV
jgi:hypothetical protein